MADHGKRPALFRNRVPLVLASKSPRRRELLSSVGLSFEVFPAEVDESLPPGVSPEEAVKGLARRKAQAVAQRAGSEAAVLAADTLVVQAGRFLGKPRDLAEARRMLKSLSGAWHEVFTGVALAFRQKEKVFFTCTRVRFRDLLPEEIEAYLATGEPLGKAGAYAIQGLAAAFVVEVQGSVTGVVGLPLAETLKLLLEEALIEPTPCEGFKDGA
ncbi:septum formation inhibitor Maf [Thermosulfurimonas marina]|uniref:dTTP/UTP pyrophosphatase n=1 Tax=Thermosulfurimonas marina TaxID=2047767 RepID=A0A6H1WUX9_9BACT|nr:Maf family protein [Thermosulfurimonas marina]QJA06959.1 septum formation inhibitor Maf [Thermosulfurimonas marina]